MDIEAKLRELLWATHPCSGKYCDDGELQCGVFLPAIDFKRDTPDEIDRKIILHCRQLDEQRKPKPPEGTNATDYLKGYTDCEERYQSEGRLLTVKKILDAAYNTTCWERISRDKWIEWVAGDICQPISKTEDNSEGASIQSPEAKPTEDGLLTEQVEQVFARVAALTPKEHKNVLGDKWKYINAIVGFIAKTASILDAKYAQEKVGFAGSIYDEAICMAEVECQQKLKGIKGKIDSLINSNYGYAFLKAPIRDIWKGVGV